MQDQESFKYLVEWTGHARSTTNVYSDLVQKQSLVDVGVTCGGVVMFLHKCVLAASSPYFREQLEMNPNTQNIIINNVDLPVLNNIIQYIYCGNVLVPITQWKPFIIAGTFFKLAGLSVAIDPFFVHGSEAVINPPVVTYSNEKPANGVLDFVVLHELVDLRQGTVGDIIPVPEVVQPLDADGGAEKSQGDADEVI